ncbi:MAG: dephospho-CoA kinase [Flavobacteriales bacterium]|nr:dephospho-CoA kinase [Flavobacteriales bacterium]
MSRNSPKSNGSRPVLIGLTGGIGSGKSIIARFWEVLGVPVYYADARAKMILADDSDVVSAVVSLFGKKAYSDGAPDRAYIASRVFEDDDLRKALNEIIHPAVGRDFEAWVEARSHLPCLVKEAAIIVETDTCHLYDVIVLVTAPEEVRIERVMARNDISRKEVEQRMAAQLSDREKNEYADFVIDNDGKKALIPAVLSLYNTLCDNIEM